MKSPDILASMKMVHILVIILIIGTLSAGLYVINQQPDLLPGPLKPLAQFTPIISETFAKAEKATEGIVGQVKENQLKPLGEQVQASKIFAVDESQDKPIHEKAFEYARYEYCQQVIRDYEAGAEK